VFEEREGGGREKQNNKIQHIALTAAQYTRRRSRKTSSIDAMAHFMVTFQYLSNK
jgi:hypothetical protein